MRDTSLRWGLGMGVLSAAIGTGALVLGALIEPIKSYTTADAVAVAVFVRGMLVLISLGLALGLAYYAGLRVARTYFQSAIASAGSAEAATSTAIASLLGVPINRRYTVLAGGLTMFCYWLITSMYIFVLPPTDQATAPQSNLLSFIESRLLLGIIYVIFGLGLGGLGGRAPAARLLLDRLTLSKPPTLPVTVPAVAPTPAQPAPQPDTPSFDSTAASFTSTPLADAPSIADSSADIAIPAAVPVDSSPDSRATDA